MQSENSLTQIDELIDKINHFHFHILKTKKNSVSEIEKGLMLAYLREMYDQILSISNDDFLDAKKTDEKTSSQQVPSDSKEEKKPVIITQQSAPVPSIIAKKEPIEEVGRIQQKKTETPHKTSISVKTDLKSRTAFSTSLNDKFQNNKTGLSEKIGEKQITDLKVAIGVNQRFGFINELFNRNTNEYDSLIKLLNETKTIDEAVNILNPIKTKNKWDEKSEVVKSFQLLIRRKFLKS